MDDFRVILYLPLHWQLSLLCLAQSSFGVASDGFPLKIPCTLRTTLGSFRLSGFFNSVGNNVDMKTVPEEVPRDIT